LAVGRQRYGLLLNDAAGIIDDLMLVKREHDIFMVVNGACKAGDIAHIQAHIGSRCQVIPMPELALLALQGPLAVTALQRLCPGVETLVFMSGGNFQLALPSAGSQKKIECFITRSGYTGEDGFEISVHSAQAEALAHALLAQPEVKPAGLGARNALRLEAGLCLYGNDMDVSTTPVEASLSWAIPKVRRSGGARAGGFSGAARVLAQLDAAPGTVTRKRVGLLALERIPVREPSELHSLQGQPIGSVTSGLLSPTLNQAIAMGFVEAKFAVVGTQVNAIVRGKPVTMVVSTLPFVPTRYHRGVPR
jgi:aminomethyltransferase